jgi:outer membrane biosynthesis protein TonB
MKNIVTTLLLITLMIPVFAAAPSDMEVNERIQKEISYPDFARRAQEEGIVVVTFSLDTLGIVTVKNASSDNPILMNYVVDKIKTISFDCKTEACKDYTIQIDFRLK